MLPALQTLPRDAELLAFETGCEDYCEREVTEGVRDALCVLTLTGTRP